MEFVLSHTEALRGCIQATHKGFPQTCTTIPLGEYTVQNTMETDEQYLIGSSYGVIDRCSECRQVLVYIPGDVFHRTFPINEHVPHIHLKQNIYKEAYIRYMHGPERYVV